MLDDDFFWAGDGRGVGENGRTYLNAFNMMA